MGFFDSLIDTSTYQAQSLAKPMDAPQGVPMSFAEAPAAQAMAKGGLADANSKIEQIQIMKVIANYFKNKGLPVEQSLAGVKKEIANGLQLIPFESSVMGMKDLGKSTAQIHFFTVGTMRDLANDMRYFYKYLKNKGINTVYDTIPAPITVEVFQKLGARIEKSDNPKYKFKAQI
jgi:hypothetical protein